MLNLSKFIAFVIVFNTFSGNVKGQTFGFNGKKNTISIFSTGGIRVFPLAFAFAGFDSGEPTLETIRYSSSNQEKKRTTIARYDLRLSYTRLINKKFGIGAEFAYERFNLPMRNFDDEFEDEYGFKTHSDQSTPVFDVFTYMLVFEFHPSSGVAPIGFSSSIGFGPKIYKFDYDENYRYSRSESMDNPYSKSSSDLLAINLFYQLNYKKVLNSFMTFDVGMRFHTGIILPSRYELSSKAEYTRGDLRDDLFVHNFGSLVSLRMGFSFLL